MTSHVDPISREPTNADAAELAAAIAVCVEQLTVAVTDSAADFDAMTMALIDADFRMSTMANDAGGDDTLDEAQRKVHEATMQLQSVDRLHQRLNNTRAVLSCLQQALKSASADIPGSAWAAFLREARAYYTMESEREVFDRHVGDKA